MHRDGGVVVEEEPFDHEQLLKKTVTLPYGVILNTESRKMVKS